MQKVKCPVCRKRLVPIHIRLGILPCTNCLKRQEHLNHPQELPEFTSQSIKQQRKEFANDIIQPFRKGELSREYVELYGTDRLTGLTKREIKRSRYVWNDEIYYKKH